MSCAADPNPPPKWVRSIQRCLRRLKHAIQRPVCWLKGHDYDGCDTGYGAGWKDRWCNRCDKRQRYPLEEDN